MAAPSRGMPAVADSTRFMLFSALGSSRDQSKNGAMPEPTRSMPSRPAATATPVIRDFTVVVLDGASPTSVGVTLDVLAAAAALAPKVDAPVPRWRVCTVGHEGPHRTQLQHGVGLDSRIAPGNLSADGSTWIIPGLGRNDASDLGARLTRPDAAEVIAALRRHMGQGGHVAASCSAVFLLQAAGVLAGRKATTAWWLASALARLEPRCAVNANRMVCADGPITTAGAAFSQTDLMLHLLRDRFGPALADAVSRVLLIDGRQAQAPYIVAEVLANGDELVSRLADRLEASLPNPPSVAQLARDFCVSERTLSRRVRLATGRSTLALVQTVRLRRARTLLENSRMTVEQVAEAVGYGDATALRRLMLKMVGVSPGKLRPAAGAQDR